MDCSTANNLIQRYIRNDSEVLIAGYLVVVVVVVVVVVAVINSAYYLSMGSPSIDGTSNPWIIGLSLVK